MPRPSEWSEEDKLCAREQARLGAVLALEEIYAKFNALLISKLLYMVAGWVILDNIPWVISHLPLAKGY